LPVPALADWDPGDGHKMHYPQLPQVDGGWDISLHNEPPGGAAVLADDWQCSESGLIDDVHFWTSWRDDLPTPIISVRVRIYSNYPVGHASNPYNYSIPGELLSGPGDWAFDMGDFTVRPYAVGPQGWFDPQTGSFEAPPDHFQCYQININNITQIVPDTQWVSQNQGEIYWLSIRIIVEDQYHFIGWKNSGSAQFMDNAVYYNPQLPDPAWSELFDPATGAPLDLAFVITGQEQVVGACCPDNGICEEVTQVECEQQLAGIYMGDGSQCSGDLVAE
jgi:hypothetical protein